MSFTIRLYRRFLVPCSVTNQAGPFLKLPLAYFSGFWLLITLLVLSSGPVYAEWVVVSGNDKTGMTVYVDPDTIRRKGDLVKVWQLIDFKTMQGGRSPGRFLSTKFQKQFDCAEERLRLLACTDFSGNMGTGEPADAYVDEGNWVPVEPDSINQALWEVACNKQ
jgi:hypothetical protein